MKLVWAMTGSGDRIHEILDIMKQLKENPAVRLTVVLSRSAIQVLGWYKLLEELKMNFEKTHLETDANTPFLAGPLQLGRYDLLIVAPLTANSAAKIAYGIADTLVTNCVAQTLKGPTPVLLYPVDQSPGRVTTFGPKGERVDVRVREVDLGNVEKLTMMRNVTIAKEPSQIAGFVQELQDKEVKSS
jgi:archaeoflavoprotein AfpA